MNFRYKDSYLKKFDRFSPQDKELIIECDKQIRGYYTSQSAPYGVRIKKLYSQGKDKIFEARVSNKIRIVWVEAEDVVIFVLLGNHDDIRNFIKRL